MMDNVIHIDEKWFEKEKAVVRFLSFDDEPKPYRSTRHKSHMDKVMFFAAVARPRFERTSTGAYECTFDGKLGCWPVTSLVPARRSSINRPAGTLEHKHLTMTSDVFRYFLICKLLPAIQSMWPKRRGEKVYIQMDNAKPHIQPDDTDWLEAVAHYRLDVELIFQPPNSPDTNVLDLGTFRHLEKITYNLPCTAKNINELVNAVETAWNESSAQERDDVFVTLHSVLRLILENNGGNDFNIPHLGKDAARRRLGTDSLSCLRQLQVPRDLVTQGTRALARHRRGYSLNPTRIVPRKHVQAPSPISFSGPT